MPVPVVHFFFFFFFLLLQYTCAYDVRHAGVTDRAELPLAYAAKADCSVELVLEDRRLPRRQSTPPAGKGRVSKEMSIKKKCRRTSRESRAMT